MMGGTCFTSFYSSFIQDLHSTGSPGVPLLKAEYTKKRRRMEKLEIRAVIKYFCKKGMPLKGINEDFMETLGSPFYSRVKKMSSIVKEGEREG